MLGPTGQCVLGRRSHGMFDSPVPSERARLAGEGEGGSKDEIDPEDHPLTRVRWSQPLVASTCELPPVVDSERKALFYSREDEMANRASVVLEASLIRCVGAVVLWCMACYFLASCARCLMYGKCHILT